MPTRSKSRKAKAVNAVSDFEQRSEDGDDPALSKRNGLGSRPDHDEDFEEPDAMGNDDADVARAKVRRKKLSGRTEKSPRDSVRTVEERLRELPEIQSLKEPDPPATSDDQTPEVDASAGPPAPPPPPIDEPRPSTNIDRGAPIPEHYGMDRLCVLVRDPYWLYVYWEMKGGALERLRFQHSAEIIDNSRWVLRVKTLHSPNNANQYVVDVDLRDGNWYLKVAPNTTFAIDMGFVDQQGTFNLVLQGNEVRTPRTGVSDVVDERWMILRDELERLLDVSGAEDPLRIDPTTGSGVSPRWMRSEKPRAQGVISSHSFGQGLK